MRIALAALAAFLTLAAVSGAMAQSAAPPDQGPVPAPQTPTVKPPPGLGGPPGPGSGDVVPHPDTSPTPGSPGAPGGNQAGPGAPGGAQQPSAPGTPGAPGSAGSDQPVVQFTRAEQLDQLFTLLAAAPSSDASTAIEKRISAIWDDSGSDTVNLLSKWADDAIDAMDFPLALDYLDRIIALKPDYVEGWDKRANVYFMTEDYGRALADIEHVLALEPRHFGALTGLGSIMHALGDDAQALVAYKAALALDPNLASVTDAISQLRDYDTHT